MENVEEPSILFSENKGNNNTEKIKHIKTNNRRGRKKNRIIKKTEEVGRVYKKKLIKTREELEMMKSRLIDVFNLPLTDVYKRQVMIFLTQNNNSNNL